MSALDPAIEAGTDAWLCASCARKLGLTKFNRSDIRGLVEYLISGEIEPEAEADHAALAAVKATRATPETSERRRRAWPRRT